MYAKILEILEETGKKKTSKKLKMLCPKSDERYMYINSLM